VFLDSGFTMHGGQTVMDGRPHALQINTKAFLRFENLMLPAGRTHTITADTAMAGATAACCASPAAPGWSFHYCVVDCRYRWVSAIIFFAAGQMPGVLPKGRPPHVRGLHHAGGLGKPAGGYVLQRPVIFRNCDFFHSLTSLYHLYGGNTGKMGLPQLHLPGT